MVKVGQKVNFLPEWQDEGDTNFDFIVKELYEDGLVLVEYQLGWDINPTQWCQLHMIEG